MLFQHPEMTGAILRGTPVWVWALLAGLVSLGITQARDRNASLTRVTILPVVMTGLAIWGVVGAFGKSPMFGYVMLTWMLVGAIAFAVIGLTNPPAGTTYDGATRTYFLPGSWLPLGIIIGIFLTRYVVNVDIAINPMLARDGQYALLVAALYGLFTGTFLGRAARLWRLAAERRAFAW
ncbi:MAG TPA: DUF6622 family protein [Ramlibacter sp.]|nr:DUF6622 family protein [Ramlibacter sp.]